MRNLLLVLLTAMLAVPAAQGHVTVNVDPVSAPVVVGQPFNVTVRFSEPCFEMPIEMAAGNDRLTAALDATAPAYAAALAGETVPWTIEDCDPTEVPLSYVRQAAQLTVVIDASAPALTNLSLPVNYIDANGGSGGAANLAFSVAYFAQANLTAKPAQGDHAGHAGANATTIELVLDYATNAVSLVTIMAVASTGEVHEVEAFELSPPSFGSNATTATRTLYAGFEPPAQWSTADVTFTASFAPVVNDTMGTAIEVATASLTLENEHAGHDGEHAGDDHDHGTHDHGDEEAPAPAFLFAIAAVGLAIVLRRRK